jgi:hypothetical protein
MQVDIQQGLPRRLDAPFQSPLDVVDVVETTRAIELDDEVCAGEADNVALDEMALAAGIDRRGSRLVFLLGGA